VEYFVYCRDKQGTAALREDLVEQHWSFMDGYVERMVARGPTVAEDGVTATGSMHIVDLPDVGAVRVFAFEEPNYKAGVYAEVLVSRWQNLLGGTMWELAVDTRDADRFLVIGHSAFGIEASSDGLPHGPPGLHRQASVRRSSGRVRATLVRRGFGLGRQRGRSGAGYPRHRRGDGGG
jgi:uncharacterized protein YciI